MAACHSQHNPAPAYGWIRRGQTREIPSNSGRQRVNLNGAIDLEHLKSVTRFADRIDAASTIELFKPIEQVNPDAKRIHLLCDNAGYYRAKAVRKFLETSKIKRVFLPPCAPNLNLIERLWKFFKKQVL